MGILGDVLKEKWFWIIVGSLILILIGSLIIILVIVLLPPPLNAILTICIIIGWGIVSGYKEWVKSREKERG
jgi:hypothetical protein